MCERAARRTKKQLRLPTIMLRPPRFSPCRRPAVAPENGLLPLTGTRDACRVQLGHAVFRRRLTRVPHPSPPPCLNTRTSGKHTVRPPHALKAWRSATCDLDAEVLHAEALLLCARRCAGICTHPHGQTCRKNAEAGGRRAPGNTKHRHRLVRPNYYARVYAPRGARAMHLIIAHCILEEALTC